MTDQQEETLCENGCGRLAGPFPKGAYLHGLCCSKIGIKHTYECDRREEIRQLKATISNLTEENERLKKEMEEARIESRMPDLRLEGVPDEATLTDRLALFGAAEVDEVTESLFYEAARRIQWLEEGIKELERERDRLANDLADALDLKNGCGPSVLTVLKVELAAERAAREKAEALLRRASRGIFDGFNAAPKPYEPWAALLGVEQDISAYFAEKERG